MKSSSIITLAFIAIFSAIFIVNTVNCENAIFGRRLPNDELLHLEIVTRKFKIINGRISEDYTFPPEGLKGTFRITNIKITDMWDNESVAELISGGPGNSTAELHLEAKLFKGFSFLIEIYGYRA